MKITETTKTLITLDDTDISKGLQMLLQAQGFKDIQIENLVFVVKENGRSIKNPEVGATLTVEKESINESSKAK